MGAPAPIPRWRFVRALGAHERDLPPPRLAEALLSFYESTCGVADAKNIFADHLVNRERESGVLTLTLYGYLVRECLYVDGKKRSCLFVKRPPVIRHRDINRAFPKNYEEMFIWSLSATTLFLGFTFMIDGHLSLHTY